MPIAGKIYNQPKYGAFVKTNGCNYRMALLVGKNRIVIPCGVSGVDARDKILNGITPNNCLIVVQGNNDVGLFNPSSLPSINHFSSSYKQWYMPNITNTTRIKSFNGKGVTWGINGTYPLVYVQRSSIPTNYINVVQYECFTSSVTAISSARQIIELSNSTAYEGSSETILPYQDFTVAKPSISNLYVNLHYATLRKTTSYNYLKALFTPTETTGASNIVYHGLGAIMEFSNTARWTVEN